MFKKSKNDLPNHLPGLLTKIKTASKSYDKLDDLTLKHEYSELLNTYMDDFGNLDLVVKHHAIVSEVIQRTIKLKPFNSQILAGICLIKRNVIEMKTGEGKTLAAVFAACFHAQKQEGVHILTFNDYLAERDACLTKPIYEYCGYSVGFITEKSSIQDRKKAYACDITYVTAREAAFDFLRDDMIYSENDRVHRGFNMAIIDEADSILIDEARVPLVISKNRIGEEKNLKKIAGIISQLRPDLDFETNNETSQIYLTDSGQQQVQIDLVISDLYNEKHIGLLNLINLSLHAHYFLRRDNDYIIRDNKVEQIDQFTGRIADRRRWPEGLQAAIEAKEELKISEETQLLGSVALKNFLDKYALISGMTGTANSAKRELKEVYDLEVIVLPSEKKLIREDLPDMIFSKKETKDAIILDEIIKTHKTGQPILVGAESVEESEQIASLLKAEGISVNLLNAKTNAEEAEIISHAGRPKSITISTAMAGRGTDIKLGSNDGEYEQVASLGGLYVMGTYRHESDRIDDQLRGRAGRQGDPGKSRFFISLEDKLLSDFGIANFLPKSIKENPNDPLILMSVNKVQNKIDEQNFKIRKTLNIYADIIENQRKIFQENREAILITGYHPVKKLGTDQQLSELANEFDQKEIDNFYRVVALLAMDEQWSKHLHLANEVKESIHLSSLARLSPLIEFSKIMSEAFIHMIEAMDEDIEKAILERVLDKKGRSKLMDLLSNPSATYTEIITDQPFGEWMELMYVPSPGTNMKLFQLFLWPILSMFKKINSKKIFI